MREMTISAVSSASALISATSAVESSGIAGRMTPPGAAPGMPCLAASEAPDTISPPASLRPRIAVLQPRQEGLGARPLLLGERLLGGWLGGAAGLEARHRCL